jgi:DnaK suppressor protein
MSVDSAFFRNQIEMELLRLDETLVQSTSAAGTVTLDQSSVGRLSRIDAMQQQAMAQGLRERLLLRKRKLEAALARIDADTFGRCCQCGAEIEAARFNADPATVFCSDCMAEREAG